MKSSTPLPRGPRLPAYRPLDEAALVAHLTAHGVAPHEPVESNLGAQGDGDSLCFTDVEGNVVELKARV
ncbi:hypothetical protein [Luteimonas sp. 3794]|uniref:hypothetical protein n=1 Tax=Luteimonas sp. 3794 TaxID=2817730 RepID=UPI0028618EC5|nr:hypothetical protein [Luteimonas sp. 3794]MDR6990424.1 hypothetical protein [Luteimonas sp. 3794]